MKDASETTSIGSRSRRDQETSNGYPPWRQFLLSTGLGSTELGEMTEVEDTNFDNGGSFDWSGNSVEEDEDIGYGSIRRFKRTSYGDSSLLLDSETSGQREPTQKSELQPLSPTNEHKTSLELTVCPGGTDSDADSRENYRKLSRLQNQRRSLVAWMALVILSCSCLAYFGAGMLQGTVHGSNRNSGLSQLFFFDTLFSGVNKKPSRKTLEKPPPLARSLLLVLRAEVTPENIAVKDMDRMLTAKGMRDAEGLGVYLQEHNIPGPDWIFVSPSERTAYTTELMRRHWGSEAPVAFEDILYTLEFNDYFSFVAGLNDQFRRVMIVGHNPAILNTAKKLMKTHGIEDFPDCGFMEIRWNDLVHWGEVTPFSGQSTMAIDPHNNFFFSSPK